MDNSTDNMALAFISNATFFPRASGWKFGPIWSLILLMLIIINNSLLLTFILSRKQLRTPFSVYVVNLLLANILVHGATNIQLVMQNYYGKWPFSRQACSFYLYAASCFGAGVMTSHVVIAVNRISAIVFPIQYRNYHTTKTAVAICIGMWIYCHAVTLPTYITDERLRPAVMENFCFFNTDRRPIWGRVLNFLVYQFSEIFVVVAYPITLFLYWLKLRNNKSVNSRKRTEPEQPRIRRENRLKHALIVLSTVTGSIVLFWTPLVAYGILKPGLKLDTATTFKYQEAVLAIYVVQPVTDPIVLTFALKDVWEELKKQVRRKRTNAANDSSQ